jgi:hypothetical protein
LAEPILYRRFVSQPLEEALDDTPVVLIHGNMRDEDEELTFLL